MSNQEKRRLDLSFLWLIVGCVFLLFMGGKWNILIATWAGSIFFVRYFRAQCRWWGILLALPFILVASHIFFLGLAVQVTIEFQILIAVSYTLYVMVPCLVDRLLYKKMNNPLLSTLVYPAALIVVQFLLSYIEELGTVLNWTGSLFSMKPFIQIVSITGVWGPSFLVGWFASLVNTLWEEQFDLKKVKLPAAIWSGVFVAAMLWGGIRMVFFAPDPGTVKVGSVVVGLPEDNLFYMYLDLPEAAQIEQKEKYRQWSREVQDKLFATSEYIIPSGIKILAWASGNAVVFAEDEAQLIQRMQNFAREHQIYFFPSLLVLGDYQGPDRNRVFAIRPDGQIEYTHFKGRNPNAGYYQGNLIEVMDTPYGRIASPICFEMEFHRFIRQVGEKNVDILIVPGDEPSKDNAIVHTELSMFRCIENGCSMLRTTLEGLTMGMDYQGRVLSHMNYYLTLDNRTTVTELPIRGVRTLYSRWGDWFAYACVILSIFLVTWGIRNVVKSSGGRKVPTDQEKPSA